MALPQQPVSVASPAVQDVEPSRRTGPGPRRPSRLGVSLAACLLAGLLLWRQAVPDATPWLDLAALTAAWVFLLTVRTLRRK